MHTETLNRLAAMVSALALLIVSCVTKVADAQTPDSTHTQSPVADSMPKLSYGGFVDTYYAWDFDRPARFDRAYTTQPARHAEFNVNLAYIETKWTGPRYRGRLALQWGTSVQANYAGEPKIGGVSGPNVSQFLQEAVVGYQLASTLWIDGGIFLSHLGYESWISRDNLAYTRSMVADFSPYYEAGVRMTWVTNQHLTTTLAIINGWQDISNYNTPPAGGLRFDYVLTPTLTLTYDDFIGDVAADSNPAQMRWYHDLVVQYSGVPWQFAVVYSVGSQSRTTPTNGTASWWGTTAIAKYHLTPRVSLVGRGEAYSDPGQVIVKTGLTESFQTLSTSLGVDVNFVGPVLWRTEGRWYRSKQAVWPLNTLGEYSPNDSFIVTSLALTF